MLSAVLLTPAGGAVATVGGTAEVFVGSCLLVFADVILCASEGERWSALECGFLCLNSFVEPRRLYPAFRDSLSCGLLLWNGYCSSCASLVGIGRSPSKCRKIELSTRRHEIEKMLKSGLNSRPPSPPATPAARQMYLAPRGCLGTL